MYKVFIVIINKLSIDTFCVLLHSIMWRMHVYSKKSVRWIRVWCGKVNFLEHDNYMEVVVEWDEKDVNTCDFMLAAANGQN